MYVLIRYPVGLIVEGVILAKGTERLRVAASGFPDTIELKCSGSQWFTASGEPVEIDFMMSATGNEESVVSVKPVQVALAAGSAVS